MPARSLSLGPAFLCADLGITPEPRVDHAAYQDFWLRVLKGDKRAIFTAAVYAQRAADFLHNFQSKERLSLRKFTSRPRTARLNSLATPVTFFQSSLALTLGQYMSDASISLLISQTCLINPVLTLERHAMGNRSRVLQRPYLRHSIIDLRRLMAAIASMAATNLAVMGHLHAQATSTECTAWGGTPSDPNSQEYPCTIAASDINDLTVYGSAWGSVALTRTTKSPKWFNLTGDWDSFNYKCQTEYYDESISINDKMKDNKEKIVATKITGDPCVTAGHVTFFGAFKTKYFYDEAYQPYGSYRAAGTFDVEAPSLDPLDFHTLAELAVLSKDGKQIIEIGWTVDPSLNNDSYPHLFIYHWVDGKGVCYNNCDGYVQKSETVMPGMQLQAGQPPVGLEIALHDDGNWWFAVYGQWMGYLPGSIWNNEFVKFDETEWYGEVASASETPKSAMGNGILGTQPGSAKIDNMALFDPLTRKFFKADARTRETNQNYYAIGKFMYDSFRYGGPGAQ